MTAPSRGTPDRTRPDLAIIDLVEPGSAGGGSDLGVLKAAAIFRTAPPDLALVLGPTDAAARAEKLGFRAHGAVHHPAGLDRLAARTLLRCAARLGRRAGVRAFSPAARAVAWRAGLPLLDHECEPSACDELVREVATLDGFQDDDTRLRLVAVGECPAEVDAHRVSLIAGLVAVSLGGLFSARFPRGAFASDRAVAHLNSLRLGTSGVELDVRTTAASSLAMVPRAHAVVIMPPPRTRTSVELIRMVCTHCETVVVPRSSAPNDLDEDGPAQLVGDAPTDAVRVLMDAASRVLASARA
ncbi:MAG: hypothetical protein AAGG07_03565 [Planctomycetota bacterium]